MMIIHRIFSIGMNAPDRFSHSFAIMTGLFGFAGFINMYVVYNLAPVTGITLPFVSKAKLAVDYAVFGGCST